MPLYQISQLLLTTTSTPAHTLGLLSTYLDPYTRIIGSEFSSRDAPYDDAPLCTLNTQCTYLPEVSPVDRIRKSHRIEDYNNSGDEFCGDVRCGNSDSEMMEDAIIEKLGDQRIIRCTEGFIEVTPGKIFKIYCRRCRY